MSSVSKVERHLNYLHLNGIDFAYYSVGVGPLIICVHGFPDTADSFKPIMPLMAAQGFTVVAPFQRGYFPSSAARDEDYSLPSLAKDILAFIDAHKVKDAIVIGHDWGALAAQLAAQIAPDKISKLILVSIPPYSELRFSAKQIRNFWYIFLFQIPWVAQKILVLKNFWFLDRLYQHWSPTWNASSAQLTVVKQSFSHSSPKPALSYYRQLHKLPIRMMKATLSMPVLTILGELDGCIDNVSINSKRKGANKKYHYETMPQVGHFPHAESPAQFFKLVKKFIGQRGGETKV